MRIAVFCGSNSGNNPEFIRATKILGKYFAENGIDIVYGGGKVGLMGVIADSVLENGGKVYGVIPQHLKDKEIDPKPDTHASWLNFRQASILKRF